jgi:hemerythrin
MIAAIKLMGKAETPLEIFTFLRQWLIEHILKTDAEYGRYLRS